MIHGFRQFARALVTALLLSVTGAVAQTLDAGAPQGISAPAVVQTGVPPGPAGPQINIAEIARRANQDVGVDIETTIPVGNASLIGWRAICAVSGCGIQS
jgi:hypothetical protein